MHADIDESAKIGDVGHHAFQGHARLQVFQVFDANYDPDKNRPLPRKQLAIHALAVACCAKEIAQAMQTEPAIDPQIAFSAGLMHDIGKVGIPSEILLKRGRLTDVEFALMRTHAEIGAKILSGSSSNLIQMSERIAAYHHERWDDSGYPGGLRGEKIPIEARIMNLADQYDALRSVRPYKPGFSHEKAHKILTEGDGRTIPGHFDPVLLDIFKENHQLFESIYDETER